MLEGHELYEAYRGHTNEVHQYRIKLYSELVRELQSKDTLGNASLIANIQRELKRPFNLMTEEQFEDWWSDLDWKDQAELRDTYQKPFDEEMRIATNSLRQRFGNRGPRQSR